MKPLEQLVRPNIWSLAPYSSARDEYNENPYNAPYNRYPDPLQREVKQLLERVKGVPAENIFLGNGSDEAIDLPYRIFCEPGRDNVVSIAPTYGMYQVCADINNVECRQVLLDDGFTLNADKLLNPNNPTGNSLDRDEMMKVVEGFEGIVIVDEAYIDFAHQMSLRQELPTHPNLIILQTMSKAWGSAAIRLGMAFASKEIIAIYNKVKYPYNVNQLTQQQAIAMLKDPFEVDKTVKMLLQERSRLMQAFLELPICEQIFPTDANFFLTRVTDATKVYNYLVDRGIIVRNRSRIQLCQNCLRITIGTRSENNELLSALRQY